jgi:protein SCO1/2
MRALSLLVAACLLAAPAQAQPAENAPLLVLQASDFSLRDAGGKPFTLANMSGRYSLMYFGYTKAPDATLSIMEGLSNIYDKMTPEERAQIAFYFVSVDPERDTPETLKDYVGAYQADFKGLTANGADAAELKKLMDSFAVSADRVDGKSSDSYTFNHTTYTYLLGPKNTYIDHFGYDVVTQTPDVVLTRLRELMAPKP